MTLHKFLGTCSKKNDPKTGIFSKSAYYSPKICKRTKQMTIPPFWGDLGVKMWPRKFCLGNQNAIFLFPKIGTFAKSANFHALKNGTLSVQMKNLRPLL